MKNIQIYPVYDIFYYSFYIAGLQSLFSDFYSSRSVANFPQIRPNLYAHNYFAAVAGRAPEIKIYIDASDPSSVISEALEWCDIYAKINVDWSNVPHSARHKVLPIGPSFGVRVWGLSETLFRAVSGYIKHKHLISNQREYLAGYWRQWRYRLPESRFAPSQSDSNYIFFAGSLWKQEAKTNIYRANFVKASISLKNIKFEGGFAPRTRNDIDGFEELTMSKRVPFFEYLEKIKASALVFNTPAVAGCHGWKLGEFLALGKAIISTPLTRALPSPLEHGVHLHYVDGSVEQIRAAIENITVDSNYRNMLEKNARDYYVTYLQPSRVIDRIFNNAESSKS